MARPWRIQYEGAIYHIISRGVGSGKIFLTNEDYSKFLEYVEKAREMFGVSLRAVNKAALRVSIQRRKQKDRKKKTKRQNRGTPYLFINK